jgi:hypothetical protein
MVFHPLFEVPDSVILCFHPVAEIVLDLFDSLFSFGRVSCLCTGLTTSEEENREKGCEEEKEISFHGRKFWGYSPGLIV